MSLRGLWRAYERLLSAKPIPTQMATSAVLWCAGDALAQLTAHVEASVYGSNHNAPSTSTSSLQPQREPQQHVGKQPATAPPHAPPSQSINQQQQQQQQPGSTPADQHQQQFVLDRRRIALTSAFGAGFIGPVGHVWYEGIEKVCRKLVPSGGARFLATKVVLDSAIMGSVYVIAFFAFIATALEGTGLQGFKHKMQVDFVPTYLAELAFWPLVQTLNFSQVPVRHQLLVVNTFSLLDAAFISWVGNQSDWASKIMQRLGLTQVQGGDKKED